MANKDFDFDELDNEFAAFNQEAPVAPAMPGAAPGAPALDANLAKGLVDSPNTSPDLKAALIKKFDLGEYSDENRRKLQEDSKLGFGDKISAALGAAGAGIMGKDAGAAGMAILNARKGEKRQALEDFEKGRAGKIQEFDLDRKATQAGREDMLNARQDKAYNDLQDPTTAASKSWQEAAIARGMDPKVAATIPGAILKERIPTLEQEANRNLDKMKYEDSKAKGARDEAFRERQFQAGRSDESYAREMKQKEFDLRERAQNSQDENEKARLNQAADKLQLEREKTLQGAGKLSEGQKAVDKDYAKDYNEWTSGGRGKAQSEINKLKGVVNRLKEGKGTTGGLTGVFGDRLTSDDVLKNRADVKQSAMALIKQNLSGATSDKDREEIVNTLWNEADSTENNITRIERFINDTQSRMDENDAKSKHFQEHRSLNGFQYSPALQPTQEEASPESKPKHRSF